MSFGVISQKVACNLLR